MVYVAGWMSNVDLMREQPELRSFLRRVADFANRLVVIDRRGTGLSKPCERGARTRANGWTTFGL